MQEFLNSLSCLGWEYAKTIKGSEVVSDYKVLFAPLREKLISRDSFVTPRWYLVWKSRICLGCWVCILPNKEYYFYVPGVATVISYSSGICIGYLLVYKTDFWRDKMLIFIFIFIFINFFRWLFTCLVYNKTIIHLHLGK